MSEEIVAEFVHPEGIAKVLIVCRADGRYTYRRQVRDGLDWGPQTIDAGVYDSPHTAVTDARLRVDWMKAWLQKSPLPPRRVGVGGGCVSESALPPETNPPPAPPCTQGGERCSVSPHQFKDAAVGTARVPPGSGALPAHPPVVLNLTMRKSRCRLRMPA